MVMQQYLHELPVGVSPTPLDDLRSKVTNDFLSEIYKVLDVNLDWVMDHQPDKLLRHNMVQRSLSLQAALGFTDCNETRSLSSKLAWTLLSLRVVSLNFAFAFVKTSNTTGGSETELSKPGKVKPWLSRSFRIQLLTTLQRFCNSWSASQPGPSHSPTTSSTRSSTSPANSAPTPPSPRFTKRASRSSSSVLPLQPLSLARLPC